MTSKGKGDKEWIGPVIGLGGSIIAAVASIFTSVWSSKQSDPHEKSLSDKLKDLEIARKKYNLSEEEYQQQKKKILETHEYETQHK